MTNKKAVGEEDTVKYPVFYAENGSQNGEDYHLEGIINSGSVGKVFSVIRQSNRQRYAIKRVFTEGEIAKGDGYATDHDIFLKNGRELMRLDNDRFIKVLEVGQFEEDKTSGKYPAQLMEYGGSDLLAVYKFITKYKSKISPAVIEAFKYKVLLNMIQGIQEYHTKNKYHCDLLPTNVLCGFDLNKCLDKDGKPDFSHLEKELIHAEVFLCDPVVTQEMRPFSGKSVNIEQSEFMRYFCITTPKPTDTQRDVYAILAHYSWLMKGDERESVETFTKEDLKLGISRTALPKLSDIGNKITAAITASDNILIKDIRRAERRDKEILYPVVYRPIDKCLSEWEGRELTTKDSLSHATELYDGMTGKTGTKDGKQTEQINKAYDTLVFNSASGLNKLLGEKCKKCIDPDNDKKAWTAKKDTAETLQTTTSENCKNVLSELETVVGQLKSDILDSNISQRYESVTRDVQKKITALRECHSNFTKAIEEIAAIDKILADPEHNKTGDESALKYIKDTCCDKITSAEQNKAVQKIISNRGIK